MDIYQIKKGDYLVIAGKHGVVEDVIKSDDNLIFAFKSANQIARGLMEIELIWANKLTRNILPSSYDEIIKDAEAHLRMIEARVKAVKEFTKELQEITCALS